MQQILCIIFCIGRTFFELAAFGDYGKIADNSSAI